VLAAGVYAQAFELVDQSSIDAASEKVAVEHALAHRDHRRAKALVDELLEQGAPRLLPQGMQRAHVGRGAHALNPGAMILDVDVAEHAGRDPAQAELAPGVDEHAFVVSPGRV